jgi:hypothetical protein
MKNVILFASMVACSNSGDLHDRSSSDEHSGVQSGENTLSPEQRIAALETSVQQLSTALEQLTLSHQHVVQTTQDLADQFEDQSSDMQDTKFLVSSVDDQLTELEDVNPIQLTVTPAALDPIINETGPRIIKLRFDNTSDQTWISSSAWAFPSQWSVINLTFSDPEAPTFEGVTASPHCRQIGTILAPGDFCEILLRIHPLTIGAVSLVTGFDFSPIGQSGIRRSSLHSYDVKVE